MIDTTFTLIHFFCDGTIPNFNFTSCFCQILTYSTIVERVNAGVNVEYDVEEIEDTEYAAIPSPLAIGEQ